MIRRQKNFAKKGCEAWLLRKKIESNVARIVERLSIRFGLRL